LAGMPTIVEIEFIDFMTLASDAVCNQAAKMRYFFGGQVKVPLVARTPIVNRLGLGAQHSQSLEAWLMHVPGLRVIIPSNAAGAGAEIARSAMEGAFDYLHAPIATVAAKDLPIPTGKLQDVVFPGAQDVEDTVRKLME